MRATIKRSAQAGSFLIEALIGILIFFLGVLTLIGLQANGVAAQTDAQSRIEAANLVDQIIGQITVGVDRSTAATLQASLLTYAYNTATALGSTCAFSGGPNPPATMVAQWNADVDAKFPSSAPTMRQILVDTANGNRVTVTLCWQTASDATPRRHSVVAYVN